MLQPYRPQQRIISLLVQEQLSAMSETRINFSIFVDVGRDHPATGRVVQVEDCTFTDVDEQSDVSLTFSHMLLGPADLAGWSATTAAFFLETADGLATEDVATEQTEHGICYILACGRTPPLHCFFHESVVILGETNEFIDNRVGERDASGVRTSKILARMTCV